VQRKRRTCPKQGAVTPGRFLFMMARAIQKEDGITYLVDAADNHIFWRQGKKYPKCHPPTHSPDKLRHPTCTPCTS